MYKIPFHSCTNERGQRLEIIKSFAKALSEVYKYDVYLMDILKVAFGAIEEKTDTDYNIFNS